MELSGRTNPSQHACVGMRQTRMAELCLQRYTHLCIISNVQREKTEPAVQLDGVEERVPGRRDGDEHARNAASKKHEHPGAERNPQPKH
eukprot:scaffold102342_cov37-Tisochrysis_lutea.AAC.2